MNIHRCDPSALEVEAQFRPVPFWSWNDKLEKTELVRQIHEMHDAGIGYGSINHPVDRDPVCGYNGVIGETCPRCGRRESDELIKFERIRRITGYLVGTLDRFNDAKRAEEHDRVKHASGHGGADA